MIPCTEWNNDQVWNVPLSLATLTDLVVMNTSPTQLGQTTLFTATVAGNGISYSWNFGDGSPLSSGSNVTHTYGATGVYTTFVTATK